MRKCKADKPAFSKILTPGTVFENLPFWNPNTPFMCGRKAKALSTLMRFRCHRNVYVYSQTCIKRSPLGNGFTQIDRFIQV